MSTKTVQVLAAVLAAVLLVSVALFVLVSAAPARGSNTPAWCDYPEPASVAALNQAVAVHLAEIRRWSPDQHPDPFTIQLDLMTECAV